VLWSIEFSRERNNCYPDKEILAECFGSAAFVRGAGRTPSTPPTPPGEPTIPRHSTGAWFSELLPIGMRF
jgi:hypothetical protein